MNLNDIYVQLVKNEIRLSEALALTQVIAPLTDVDSQWIASEICGYPEKLTTPEYRQLPCKVKARAKCNVTGDLSDINMRGGGLDDLDTLLKNKLGLSIYKLYISQGIEWIEKQVLDREDGDLIMMFEGGHARELRQSLSRDAARNNYTVQAVFQSTSIYYAHNLLYVVKNKLLILLKNYLTIQGANKYENNSNKCYKRKIVFISYSWEGKEHNEWVHRLAEDLSNEFEVIIDQDQPLGLELTPFMEHSIVNSDKVLIIVTPTYKNKADNRIKGVGYETSIITDELVTDQNKIKFIPIIRVGTKETSYPKYLGSRKGLDMIDDARYQDGLDVLRKNILEF